MIDKIFAVIMSLVLIIVGVFVYNLISTTHEQLAVVKLINIEVNKDVDGRWWLENCTVRYSYREQDCANLDTRFKHLYPDYTQFGWIALPGKELE